MSPEAFELWTRLFANLIERGIVTSREQAMQMTTAVLARNGEGLAKASATELEAIGIQVAATQIRLGLRSPNDLGGSR